MAVSSVTRTQNACLPWQARWFQGARVARLSVFVKRSRALASLAPAFLGSGLIALAVGTLLRMMPVGFESGGRQDWLEDWLLTWAIGFPLVYMARQALLWLLQDEAPADSEVKIFPGRPRRPGL